MTGLRIERDGDLELWRLDKPRGNAIDEPLVMELLAACDRAAADESVHGVLLASAHEKLFCPGLDLVALSGNDRAAMERFVRRFGRLIVTLYGFPKPVVAALAGHAVAGGCILALGADWRVLRSGGVQVGLGEGRVGVPMPWPVAVLLRATLAPPMITRVGLLGRNFTDAEALAVGLGDEVHDADGFEEFCRERLAEFADKDALALRLTKSYLRAPALAAMQQRDESMVEEFLDAWFSPATQSRIRAVVASLQRV
ncbi:MAG: enoyl-CoA hydratase/isomerase family protein [Deltaproteobacteria bacterium]|nr:enoyl-CoA hydratase/isomerase family protein [Deltaproteobacteria bacterium]